MEQWVFEICRMVAIIIGVVLAYYIIPTLKVFVEKHLDDNITGFINACVYAAQQIITDEDKEIANKRKKQYVLDHVTDWLKDKGIVISVDQLDILIESAVLAMKTETK